MYPLVILILKRLGLDPWTPCTVNQEFNHCTTASVIYIQTDRSTTICIYPLHKSLGGNDLLSVIYSDDSLIRARLFPVYISRLISFRDY